MQPLNPIRPDEVSGLLMENELLRHEVSHLRARLAAATTRPSRGVTAKGGKAADHQGAARKPDPAAAPASETARNQAAYDDLVWLLGRLDGSPAGVLLRRVEGFRTLRARYLAESPS